MRCDFHSLSRDLRRDRSGLRISHPYQNPTCRRIADSLGRACDCAGRKIPRCDISAAMIPAPSSDSIGIIGLGLMGRARSRPGVAAASRTLEWSPDRHMRSAASSPGWHRTGRGNCSKTDAREYHEMKTAIIRLRFFAVLIIATNTVGQTPNPDGQPVIPADFEIKRGRTKEETSRKCTRRTRPAGFTIASYFSTP